MEEDEGSIEVGKAIEDENEDECLECYPCFGSSEEAKEANSIITHNLPSQREIDEHMLTHITDRSWCKLCIIGKRCIG